ACRPILNGIAPPFQRDLPPVSPDVGANFGGSLALLTFSTREAYFPPTFPRLVGVDGFAIGRPSVSWTPWA
ncbi:MAG: hypothetical protein ACE5JL_14555, partial [Dehalococcoidia bacterium]